MTRTLVLLLLLLGWPAWAGATIFWDDELDEGNTGFADDGAPGCPAGPLPCNGENNAGGVPVMAYDTAVKHSGTGSMRLNYPPNCEDVTFGGPGCSGAIGRTFPATRTLYMRVYFRMSSGFQTSINTYTKMMYSRGDIQNVWAMGGPQTFGGSKRFAVGLQDQPTPGDTITAWSTKIFSDATWYCLETLEDANAGVTQAWVDGVLVLNRSGDTYPAGIFNAVLLFRQTGVGSIWYDKFAAGDARPAGGLCSGGGPVDTIPPSPVQGLAAVENVSGTGTITWQATIDSGSSRLASYALVRCTGAACTPTVTLTTTGPSAVSYSDVGLAGSTTYGYAIRATDNAGNSTTNSSPPVYITTNAQVAGALSLDAVSSSPDNITLGTVSWPHTIGSVNNRLIAVCTQARDANSTDANVGVSSVTLDGVALTQVPSAAALRSDTTNRYGTDLWYLVNPAIGPGMIAMTFGGTPSRYGVGSAVSYSGVHQTTPIDATAVTGTGSGTTLSAAITSATDAAMIMDCALGGDALTIGAGQTARVNRTVGVINASNDGAGMSTVAKATAGAETMDWTMATNNWAMSTVVWKPTSVAVAPRIASLTVDATGANLTYGATTPTSIRIATHSTNILYDISAFPAGRFTAPGSAWPPAAQQSDRFVCAFARDAAGVETITSLDYQCGVPPALATIDTAVPVMTLSLPSAALPFGTTSTTIALTVDKTNVACRYAATDIAYSAMSLTMAGASLTRSATVGSLTTGTVHRYARCNFTDVLDVEHPNLTSLDIPITVEASTADTTPPATVSGLRATSLPNAQVQLDWTAVGGDTVGYQGYLCQGVGCSTMLLTGLPVTNTQLIVALGPGLPYSFCVKAIDSSNNLSAACSTLVTLTTSALSDLVPPSTMANLRLYGSPFTNAVVLTSDPGTDDKWPVTTVIELSTTGCGGPFNLVYTHLTLLAQVNNLTSSTAYCARGAFSDGTWLGGYSNTLPFTTAATGLMYPRFPVPFSQPRTPLVIPRSGLSRDRSPRVP